MRILPFHRRIPLPVIILEAVRTSKFKYFVHDDRVEFIGPYKVIIEDGKRVVRITAAQAAPWLARHLIGTIYFFDRSWAERKKIWEFSGRRIIPDRAPIVANAIPNQNATELTPINFTFASNTFSDPDDATAFFAYTVRRTDGTKLPSWLSFNPLTRNFFGTPPNGSAATISVRVTARDPFGQTVFDDFNFVIAPD